jgi:alpha-D-ribose 1-methylphosphonate 5-triphosphate diphosphatase
MDWITAGGQALLEGRLVGSEVALADGLVALRATAGARSFDAGALLVLAGLVDIHGDTHERLIRRKRRFRALRRRRSL